MTIINSKKSHDRHNLSAFLDSPLDYHSDFEFLQNFILNKNEISLSNIDLHKHTLNPEVIIKYYLMCSIKNQTNYFWSVFWKYILTVKDPPIVCYPHPVEKSFMDNIQYFEDLLDALSCTKKESLVQLSNFIGDVFADTLAIESTASIKGNLYYNNLRAQPGAKLDVQLIKGLDKKEKTSQKNNSSKKAKKV